MTLSLLLLVQLLAAVLLSGVHRTEASDPPQIIYETPEESGLSDGEIGAVAAGAFLGLSLLVGLFCCCFFRCKRRESESDEGLEMTDTDASSETCRRPGCTRLYNLICPACHKANYSEFRVCR